MVKSEVIALLEAGEADIVFTKVNGTVREMRATRSTEIIPNGEEYDLSQNVSDETSSLAVWDCEVTGWRAFRWDLLTSVNGEPYDNG